jgi:hypothetical protein
VVFECKRYTTRKVGIGAVDASMGKCINMQIGHGVLYAFGGFDAGAEARARASTNPNCWDRVWILDEDPASDIRDGVAAIGDSATCVRWKVMICVRRRRTVRLR